jgi:hypothetical protein
MNFSESSGFVEIHARGHRLTVSVGAVPEQKAIPRRDDLVDQGPYQLVLGLKGFG